MSKSLAISGWNVLRLSAVFIVVAVFGLCAHPESASAQDPITKCASPGRTAWARPVELRNGSVQNLYQVTSKIYRSSQPSEDEFGILESQLHIRTVISLRRNNQDELLIKDTKLVPLRFKLVAKNIHNQRDLVVKALRAVWLESKKGPILVHCWHGSDRTGMIIALYRILYENWCKKAAIEEMIDGGFGFHEEWFENIPLAIERIDLARLKRDVEKGH